jgi:hypothetical protein
MNESDEDQFTPHEEEPSQETQTYTAYPQNLKKLVQKMKQVSLPTSKTQTIKVNYKVTYDTFPELDSIRKKASRKEGLKMLDELVISNSGHIFPFVFKH